MTNRLQSLELERERLEKVLADDANWCAFLEAQRRRAAGLPGSAVTKEIARALAENQTVFAYLKIAEEIAAETAKSVVPPSTNPGPSQAGLPSQTQTPVTDTPVQVARHEPGSESSAPEKTAPPDSSALTDQGITDADAGGRIDADVEASDLATSSSRADVEPTGEAAEASTPGPATADVDQKPISKSQDASRAEVQTSAQTETRDDLTLIRSIDRALAARLNAVGVTSFLQIAQWTSAEVHRVRDALDLDLRIGQENWIEQAALKAGPELVAQTHPPMFIASVLRDRSDSANASGEHHATDAVKPERANARENIAVAMQVATLAETGGARNDQIAQSVDATIKEGERKTSPEVSRAVASQSVAGGSFEDLPEVQLTPAKPFKVGRKPKRLPPPAARRFTYIRGVSDEISEALRSAGVSSIADIAGWTRADVRWFKAILGETARISQDQWIEQARLLANGAWTKYALRVVNGDTRTLVVRPQVLTTAQPVQRDKPTVTRVVAPVVSGVGDIKDGIPGEGKPPSPINIEAGATGASARALSPRINLGGRLRRPPPDLGMRWRQPVQSVAQERVTMPVPEAQSTSKVAEAEGLKPAESGREESVHAPPELMQRLADANDVEVSAKVEQADLSVLPDATETTEAPGDTGYDDEEANLSEDELARLVEADDWDDADALVVERGVESKIVEPALSLQPETDTQRELSSPTLSDWANALDGTASANEAGRAYMPELGNSSEQVSPAPPAGPTLVLPDIAPEPIKHPIQEPFDENEDSSPDIAASGDVDEVPSPFSNAGSDAELSFAGEADVVIVSRPRVPVSASEEQPVSEQHEPDNSSIQPALPVPTARRMQNRRVPNDALDGERASFSAASEEATVTIIRAEATETDAASVVPTDIANDPDGGDIDARPTVRRIGSRFLKALTGD